ncbi:MAG: hypothetical protein JW838_15570 [Spirochaetes bacterium]|nr:hypothetical protein [Spirochaetota bacterium]
MTPQTEEPAVGSGLKPERPRRWPLFTIINIMVLVLIPPIIVAAMAITVILRPGFYTGILKQGRLITAYVEGRNWDIEKRINDEIERELQMSRHAGELDRARFRHEKTLAVLTDIRKDEEFESLERERKEIKGLNWKDVSTTFPTREAFTRFRDQELRRIDERLAEIREHRSAHEERIEAAEDEMIAARKEYDAALSVMEDKEKEAKKIAERHRDESSDSVYSDLARIEGPLTKILNERLIDGEVRYEIEKFLAFITDYDRQVEERKIYYVRSARGGIFGLRSLRVRLPSISLSLWVDDESPGGRKRHVLSDLLADEVKRIEGLQNRFLLTTLFRLSDTRLGEYVGGKRLAGLGLSIRNGVIHMPGPVLDGEHAETAALVMRILSIARYAPYGAAGVLLLYILYLFFSTVERRRKLVAMKRLFIYPSLLVIAACGALLWASLNIFTYYPGFLGDLAARSYIRHLGFTAAWHFAAPLFIVFGSLLVAGLLIRKHLARVPAAPAGEAKENGK